MKEKLAERSSDSGPFTMSQGATSQLPVHWDDKAAAWVLILFLDDVSFNEIYH
jgi:hypothetical protein